MKRLWLILAFGVLLPATARAEPIAISVQSSSGGFSGGTVATGSSTIALGTVDISASSVGTYLISGLTEGVNYTVSMLNADGSPCRVIRFRPPGKRSRTHFACHRTRTMHLSGS